MASEYFKWLARNEKPAEKKQMTKKEKWQNWWYYHRIPVIVGAILVAILLPEALTLVSNWLYQPDYQVRYIGSQNLSEKTVEDMEKALEQMGEDLNGDGKVLVTVNQSLYVENDTFYNYNAQMLTTALDEGNFFYLLEDPQTYQDQYHILARPDGSVPPEEEPSEQVWLAWGDCPVLVGMELEHSQSQQELSGLYIARRVIDETSQALHVDGCVRLWEKMIQGATE